MTGALEELADSAGGLGTWTWLLGVLEAVVSAAAVVVFGDTGVEVTALADAELEPAPDTKYFSRIGR